MSIPTIRAALDAAEQHATAEVWADHPLAIILAGLIKQTRAALKAEPVGEGLPADIRATALLHPAYEPGDGSADGAQMVGLAWWHPVMGCDSLQIVVDNARNILRSRWARPATPPALEVGSAAALATWLQNHSGQCVELGRPDWAHMANRAADTLEAFSLGGWIVPTVEEATPPAPEVGEVGRLRIMAAGIRYGYMAGHDDTVKGRYGDPDEVAADAAPVVLGELGATFESMLEQQAQPATDQAEGLSLADVDELCKEFGFHYADGETWVLGYNDTLAVLQEMITAALLQQPPAPAPAAVPVAVAERPWEREGWCDEQGYCWFGWAAEPGLPLDASWSYCKPSDRDTASVSAPHHAIPLPQIGEGE